MKITIRQTVLLEALNNGALAAIWDFESAESNSTFSPIQKSVKITAGKKIIIESSNELISMRYSIDAKEENGIKIIDEGEILVPAQELIDWVKVQGKESIIGIQLNKLQTPEKISLGTDEEKKEILFSKIGVAKISSKDDNKTIGKWEIDCYDTSLFKNINFSNKTQKLFDINSEYLIGVLKTIGFAGHSTDSEHITDSVSIQNYKKDIYFTTTDKARCAVYKISPDKLEDIQLDSSILISYNVFKEISNIIDKSQKISFFYDAENNKIFLRQPKLDIRIITIDKDSMSKFPSVRMLLDKTYNEITEISKGSLLKMLYTASVVNNYAASFNISSNDAVLTIKAISEDSKYKPNITQTPVLKPNSDLKTVLSVSNTIEVLKIMKSERVKIYVPENNKSLKITGQDDDGFLYYTMVINNSKYFNE